MEIQQHSGYCRKEKEIAEINADVKMIKKIVLGNGREGLAQSVPKLSQNVEDLKGVIKTLSTGVSGLLRFQNNMTGEKYGKEEIRKRNRWIIGILITTLVSILGTMIYLVDRFINHI